MARTDSTDHMDALPLTPITFHLLLSLADQDLHGYAILKDIQEQTGGRFRPEAATLYAALKRLKGEGLIEVVPEEKRPPGGDSRRRIYRLTSDGKRVLAAETERLAHLLGVAARKELLSPKPAQ